MASNSSRWYLEKLIAELARTVPTASRVLDAGAGHCPYRPLFAHANYESADFCQVDKRYGAIDFVCDLSSIPVDDDRYDYVFCTQVLEHLANPGKTLREFHRVLRSGGRLCLSAPLYYEEHEQPYDFYRYTQFGLTHLLNSAGFEVDTLQWLEGYCGTIGHQFKKAARWLPRRPADYGGGLLGIGAALLSIVLRPILSLLARWFIWMDTRHKYTESGHCINYFLVAHKVADRQSAAA